MSTPPTERSTPPRFPAEIIGHGVGLDSRLCRSSRGVAELLCARGVLVPDEAIRTRGRKVGPASANQWRRRRPEPGGEWHPDEVLLTINGARHDLWRAVDQGTSMNKLTTPWRGRPTSRQSNPGG